MIHALRWHGTRLKPNGHLLEQTALSSVVELEMLRLGVEGKAAGWRTLCALADRDSRLDEERLNELISRRAGSQTASKNYACSLPPRPSIRARIFLAARLVWDGDQLVGFASYSAKRPAAAAERLPAAQQMVLALMAEGLHDDVIARRARLSTTTVRRHITAIMKRLDMTSRFAAGAAAQRRAGSGRPCRPPGLDNSAT